MHRARTGKSVGRLGTPGPDGHTPGGSGAAGGSAEGDAVSLYAHGKAVQVEHIRLTLG